MKKTFILLLGWFVLIDSYAQTAGSIIDINDKAIKIDSLQGKKILLIILPVIKDTAIINQLLRFQKKYEKQVQVIGLVNTQSGGTTKEFYKNTYGDASTAGITISEGIQPVEKVTDERNSVIQWVSGRNKNRELDRFATGSKYFISEDGRMSAQLGKETSLDAPLVKSILNAKVPVAIKRAKEIPTPSSTPKSNNP